MRPVWRSTLDSRLSTLCFAALLCAGASGCQSRTPAGPQTPPNRTAPALTNGAAADTVSDEAKQQTPAKPQAAPVIAVREVLGGVDAGRLEAIADFLPESYQQDVNAVVRAFAEKLPDELWTRLHTIAVKVADVLKKTARPQEATSEQNDDDEFSARLAKALDPILAAEAWDRDQWQQFDLRTFLEGPASTAFTAWRNLSPTGAPLLSDTEIELVEMADDHAVLTMRSPLDAEPREVKFVQREGKWIPEALADGWEDSIGKLSKQLSALDPERMVDVATRLRPMLLQVEHTLDQMLAADRPEAVQLGWWQIQSLLVQGREAFVPAGPPPQVAIRIGGEPSEEDLDQLLQGLVEATDNPDAAEYVTFPTATGMVILLSPVENFAEFVRRLTFVKVQSQDAGDRSVEVELSRSPS